MRQIITTKKQNIFDLAIQEYGNVAAAFQILADNPELSGLNALPDGYVLPDGYTFDLSYPLKEGLTVNISEDTDLVKLSTKNKITNVISGDIAYYPSSIARIFDETFDDTFE